MAPEGGPQFAPGIAAIGEHVAQPGEAMADGPEDAGRTVAVLHAGRMDDRKQQQAERIGHDMALASLDLLAVRHGPRTVYG